ncbi:hypothetical protein HYC85_007215 [Camellia sinensis]|uniref:Uncharacterized protein n=1 Tax=Camellia sinensis TaxID=4442 RepID=A0A7J7HNR1_CAMSI|nr:hypothetical protein HYC85_007215 [Camellia sinensis]
MCPLRLILIFLSATLAGFLVLKNLKSQPQILEEDHSQDSLNPTSSESSPNHPPLLLPSIIRFGEQSVLGSGPASTWLAAAISGGISFLHLHLHLRLRSEPIEFSMCNTFFLSLHLLLFFTLDSKFRFHFAIIMPLLFCLSIQTNCCCTVLCCFFPLPFYKNLCFLQCISDFRSALLRFVCGAVCT